MNKYDIDIEKGNTGYNIDNNKIMLSYDHKLQNYIIKKIVQPSYI